MERFGISAGLIAAKPRAQHLTLENQFQSLDLRSGNYTVPFSPCNIVCKGVVEMKFRPRGLQSVYSWLLTHPLIFALIILIRINFLISPLKKKTINLKKKKQKENCKTLPFYFDFIPWFISAK